MGEKKDSFRFTVQFNAGDPSHQQVAAGVAVTDGHSQCVSRVVRLGYFL